MLVWTALAGIMALAACSERDGAGATPAAPAATARAGAARAEDPNVKTEKAMFGAGCFWGVESTFRKVPGVIDVAVGYSGGHTANPTYEDVCSDATGHAEVVEVTYDPAQVSYGQLLAVFFENHDPTTLNRQGPDWGTQYRSAIFYYTPEQQTLAEAEIAKRNKSGEYVGPIVTEVSPAKPFYRAEEYHQKYFAKKGVNWTCHTGNGKKGAGGHGW
jgi:peptide-methionine (S)-S-oxide reductase